MGIGGYLIDFYRKQRGALAFRSEIETIVLGSSHGDFSFDPHYLPGSYNLCTRSQDLYYSSALHKWSLEHLRKVKNVVLFYSVFSGSFELCKSSEADFAVALSKIFGVKFSADNTELQMKLLNLGSLQFSASDCDDHFGYIHIDPIEFISEDYTSLRRALDHQKLSEFQTPECIQHEHLDVLLSDAKMAGRKVTIVVSPTRSDYRNHLPSTKNLFNSVSRLADVHNIKLINLFDSQIFYYDEFGDFDHLNPRKAGPKKLVKIVADGL